MKFITNEEFIQKMLDADEWQITTDPLSGQPILITRNYIKNSDYGVALEEQFMGQNPMDISHEEFVAFHKDLQAIMNGYKKPKILIGYKIGDHIYHPDDVELIYAHGYAEPQSDAAPVGGREETPEREHPEGRSRDREDENRDGILRDSRSLGETLRRNHSKET